MQLASRLLIARLSFFVGKKNAVYNRNVLSSSAWYSLYKYFLRITEDRGSRCGLLNGTGMAASSCARNRMVSADGVMKSEFPPLPIQKEHFSKTFLDAIWRHFSDDPDRAAIINDESDRVTFGQLYVYCQSVAAFLKKHGFEKQQVACIVTPNCWQYMAVFGGVVLRHGILSGASPAFTSSELKQQFDDSKCTFIFTSEDCMNRVIEAIKTNENVKAIIVIPERRSVSPKLPKAPVPIFSLADVVREDPTVDPPMSPSDFNADEEVMILPYSSGTTGLPKGVMLSHKNFGSIMNMYTWQFNHKVLQVVDPNFDYKKETQLNLLPFYHIFGFAVIVNHLLNGSTVVVLKAFKSELFCSLLQKYKCRFLMVVPPLMIFLAKSPMVDNYDLSNLKLIVSGAAPAGRELCEKLQRRFPQLTITQGYGMTELSIGSHIPVVDGKDRFDKAGKLLPNMELKVRFILSESNSYTDGNAFTITMFFGYWISILENRSRRRGSLVSCIYVVRT